MNNYTILIANGPNLGHLGLRQPEIYGKSGMQELPELVNTIMGAHAAQVKLDFFQSNSEGALIDRFEQAREEQTSGIVLNAGAYTHTSLALADCLGWINIPCIEVHISNIWARTDEPLRQQSFIGKQCVGAIAGFGILGYALAVQALVAHLEQQNR